MTKEERSNPELLNASRRKRIAAGSGTTIQEVNRFIKQFDEMKKMMKQFTGVADKMKKKAKKKGFGLPFMGKGGNQGGNNFPFNFKPPFK